MEVILSSHIARVVLAYLYDQKLNRAADEFCKASPYLKEERNCLKSGFRPAMYISFKLTDLFREYSEIQIKLNNFVEKYGNQLEIPSDLSTLKKIDYLLAALRKNRRIKVEPAPGRKRKIPSPQPSLASSTPEVAEPKQKRLCMNRSFIVLNDSGAAGRNLSNLSHISAIDGTTTQDDAGDDESKDEEEEEQEMSQIDMWKQTLLENEIYPEKIADLINKELETSMNQQQQQQVPEAEVKEAAAPVVQEQPEVAKMDSQSCNFNIEDLISNIVNNIPVFEDMLEESKPETAPVVAEERPTTPVSETPLKARLRKTCKKNYANLSPLKKSCKKVKVISDVPYEGAVPEVLRSLKIDPPPVQPEVSSTEDQPIASSSNSATQYYVIQSDNTTKLVDINQLQFPTQPTITVAPEGTQNPLPQTLIPIAGNGIPENTYFILDSQLPLVLGAFTNEPQPETVPAPVINPPPETLLSPDKFLIFPSSAPAPVPIESAPTTTSAVTTTTTTTASIAGTIPATLIKPEVKTTPQNVSIPNPKARSASTPSRKASHIRILNFHTPAKPSALAGNRIATPGSAPASVDNRRLPLTKLSNLLEEQEPSPSPITTKLAGDWDAVHGIGAITAAAAAAQNPNSVSNTPRVSRKPSARVLSRAGSAEPAAEPEVFVPETPAPPEVAPKPARTPVAINPSDMEEWRRIRAVSKSNFDQHLRLVEEQKQHSTKMLPRKKRPTPATAKKKKKKSGDGASQDSGLNESGETTVEGDSSLTDAHAQMLEDALASAKKGTPIKREEVVPEIPAPPPPPPQPEEEPEDNAKIYVKIATPKKKAEAAAAAAAASSKVSPKRKKSAKKRRSGSARKKVVKKKKPEVAVESEKVASPKPVEEPKKVKNPVKEEPVKPEVPEVPEVHVTPPEPPKAVKDHPKVLAKKSSAEYARLEKEQQQQLEAPEVPPAPSDFSFNVSNLLETPFKAELENFPVTPRFLMPDPLQDTPITKIMRDLKSSAEGSSVATACEIQTPSFPITPGLISTPKSVTSVTSPQSTTAGGFSSRRTDYSSGSSYYKPDESEDLDKNLETMLQNERRKRPPVAPEQLPAPEPEPVPEPPSHNSSSSSSSSSSSDSSSSSASSPETSPVKQPEAPSPAKPAAQLLQSSMQNIFEMRRLQRAELEAKKQRTIARMKTTKMSPPPKRIERKFSGAPGFRARKVVVSRGTKEPPKKVSPKSGQSAQTGSGRAPLTSKPVPPLPTKSTSSSSKRKNPTPRKVVYLDKAAPIPPKKHSPKRKPPAVAALEHTRKSPRTQPQPKPTHPIEGTYESENLSRLCCTPDPTEPEPENALAKKQVYSFKSPERLSAAAAAVPPEVPSSVTPDSNKENLSGTIEEEGSSSSEDEDDEFSFRTVTEDSSECYFRFQFDEKKKGTVAPSTSPSSPQVIKKCNIVMEGRKICIQAHDVISLFEQEPTKKPAAPAAAAGSPKKKSNKSTKSSSKKPPSSKEIKKPEPPAAPPVVPAPVTPSIKAKINVVSAVRTASNPITGKRGNHQVQQRSSATPSQQKMAAAAATAAGTDSGRSLLKDSAVKSGNLEARHPVAGSGKSEKENGAASSGSAAVSGEKVDSV